MQRVREHSTPSITIDTPTATEITKDSLAIVVASAPVWAAVKTKKR